MSCIIEYFGAQTFCLITPLRQINYLIHENSHLTTKINKPFIKKYKNRLCNDYYFYRVSIHLTIKNK